MDAPIIPPTLKELRRMRTRVRNINIEYRERLSRIDRLALWVTEHVGSVGFFSIVFLWTVVWIAWNILVPAELKFDPFPAFVMWLFISNMIQLMLMPLIMVGQNLQGRHSEARAEADFEVNTRAEREIEAILMHLENQNELILKILRHLEK
ncbi:DUF1003 domain-containing protein [Patescibacteria group bacterium]|nr:DUF1003 domain-containing protein [Patescibacteria group bacterium]